MAPLGPARHDGGNRQDHGASIYYISVGVSAYSMRHYLASMPHKPRDLPRSLAIITITGDDSDSNKSHYT